MSTYATLFKYYLNIICIDQSIRRLSKSHVHTFSGIVVWGTATLPYLVLTILLIRGLMLPGSLTGITYYLQPELYRLLDTQVTFWTFSEVVNIDKPSLYNSIFITIHDRFYCLITTYQVWVDAAVQIFYSVGAGFGVHLSYASYNNIKNNCYTYVHTRLMCRRVRSRRIWIQI